MKKILYILLCCVASLVASAQNDYGFFHEEDPGQQSRPLSRKDSSARERPEVPHFRVAWQWVHGGLYKRIMPLDSLADGIYNYNVIFKRDISNSYLGNFPSPYESNIFIHRERNEDFYPLNTVRAYLFKPEDALEYNVTTPFTRIDYFNGGSSGQSENWLDVWHVQNIKSYWSAGIRYNLISSDGSYTYQKSKVYNFALFSSYERRRVAVSFFINQNMGHFNENGGVADFSEIRDTILNSQYVLTRLNGEPSNNYQNFNFNVTLQYNIGKGKPVVLSRDSVVQPLPRQEINGEADTAVIVPPPVMELDSSRQFPDSLRFPEGEERGVDSLLLATELQPEDSLARDSLPEVVMTYPVKATLSIRVQENKHAFKEQNVETGFFSRTYIDSLSNDDRYRNNLVEIAGRLIINEHPRYTYLPGIHAGLTYKYLDYQRRVRVDNDSTTADFGTDHRFGVYLTAGMFNVDTSDLFHFDASGSLCLLGDYITDYTLQGDITQFLARDRNTFVKIKGTLRRATPNAFLDFQLGNHDRWENRFDKVNSYELEGSFHHTRYRAEAGIGLSNTTGYIYLDAATTPRQHDGGLFVLTAWAKQVFKLGHFYFDQKVYYQVSNRQEVLSLPRVALYSHNYYQGAFFKKVLGVQAGVDLFYNTAFYASAYAPSIMQFYNQRAEKTGNYPKIDVFIALRVKRADIFLKYEHLSQYFANRNYFSAYAYPINPARFKYGVRWNFFD